MDIKQINSAIMFGSLTDVELNSIIDAVKFRRATLQRTVRYVLRNGQRVRWNSTKQGRVVEGTVIKVAQKFATVAEIGRMASWKVPMNMLEVV
jgi:hypothetical protein